MPRLWGYKKSLASSAGQDDGIAVVPADEPNANLVSSLTDIGLHMPVLDIDYWAELIPSSTPGHFHLYLNKMVDWPKYKAVLTALADAGLIQRGFAQSSIDRAQSYVRKPGVKKGEDFVRAIDKAEAEKAKTFDPDEIPF